MQQQSDDWHKARAGRITASRVGAILGCAPYQTRDGVMREMVRQHHGAEKEFNGNIATEYGNNNEDGALIDFRIETGLTVENVGFITKEDWAGCSPDGLIGDKAGIEIKCPFGKRKHVRPDFKPLADQPHYYAQIQFSLWVTGRAEWYFFQWCPAGIWLETVLPDQKWLDENLPVLRQFYAEYLSAIADPADYLGELRPEIDTPEMAKMLREYDELSEAIDNATERKKALLEDIVAKAGDRNALVCGRKLTEVKKDGAISYAKAIKELAPNADLEKWRGNPSRYWKLG